MQSIKVDFQAIDEQNHEWMDEWKPAHKEKTDNPFIETWVCWCHNGNTFCADSKENSENARYNYYHWFNE